jgi:hypothetical protein
VDTAACRGRGRIPRKMDTKLKWIKSVMTIAVFGVFYYATARLGLWFSFEESNASPVWPADGLALAGCLFFGPRVCPAIWLGSFAANALDFWSTAAAAPGTVLWVSASLACGNVAVVLLGWFLCHRWSETTGATLCRDPLVPEINVFRFAALALLAGLLSACIGTTVVCAGGHRAVVAFWAGLGDLGVWRCDRHFAGDVFPAGLGPAHGGAAGPGILARNGRRFQRAGADVRGGFLKGPADA